MERSDGLNVLLTMFAIVVLFIINSTLANNVIVSNKQGEATIFPLMTQQQFSEVVLKGGDGACKSMLLLFYFPWDSIVDDWRSDLLRVQSLYNQTCYYSFNLHRELDFTSRTFSVDSSPALVYIRGVGGQLVTVEYNGIMKAKYIVEFLRRNDNNQIWYSIDDSDLMNVNLMKDVFHSEFVVVAFFNSTESNELYDTFAMAARDNSYASHIQFAHYDMSSNINTTSLFQPTKSFIDLIPGVSFEPTQFNYLEHQLVNEQLTGCVLIYLRNFNTLKLFDATEQASLVDWIKQQAHPILNEITASNFRYFMETRTTSVIMFMNDTVDHELRNSVIMKEMSHLAAEFAQSIEGGLNFVYMDGIRFEEFLFRLANDRAVTLPALAVIQPKQRANYICIDSITNECCFGHKFYSNMEDQSDKDLRDFIQHFVKPYNTDHLPRFIAKRVKRTEHLSLTEQTGNHIQVSLSLFEDLFSRKNSPRIHETDTLLFAVLYLYSPSCGYCHKMNELYREAADQFKDRDDIIFTQMNVDANDIPALVQKKVFSVDRVPTLISLVRVHDGSWHSHNIYFGERILDHIISWVNLEFTQTKIDLNEKAEQLVIREPITVQ